MSRFEPSGAASPFSTWQERPPPPSNGENRSSDPPTALQVITRCPSGPCTLPFRRMCQLFEHLLSSVNKAQQNNYLDAFWKSLPKDQSFFPYMRLVLPHLDNVRPLFHLRESKLARLYVDVLGLSHHSSDAQRLLHWKDPTKSNMETTCFSDVIFIILQQKGGFRRRSASVERGTKAEVAPSSTTPPPALLTVDGANAALDDLANADTAHARIRVLVDLLQRTSPLEQKWLLRIVLKDMKFRITHQSILFAFHPSALDKLNSTNDLQYVCDHCMEEMQRPVTGSSSAGIFLFQPIRPMLASPVTTKKLEQLLETEKVSAESKYDGERIMIHVNAAHVMYWTRNAKDFSALYGPKFDDVVRTTFPVGKQVHVKSVRHPDLEGQFRLENVILDGELLVFDGLSNAFAEFGMNRTFATAREADFAAGRDVDGSNRWFCYMIFDILLLNGISLMHLPLSARRAVMNEVLVQKPKHAEMVDSHPVGSVAEILISLERAVENKMEGIVLKMGDSPYVPAERKHRWVKVKPDHIAGLADSIDLVVVGGYYGTKFGVRHVSHFLLATWANRSAREPTHANARFHTVCKIGNGYTSEELNVIHSMLEPFWETMPNRQTVPEWLDGWKPVAGDLIPDLYVHPSKSVVLEVFGYSFTDSLNYRVGYTIRFPRMLRIRTDKSLADATDLDTLGKVKENSRDALKRRVAGGRGEFETVVSLKWKQRKEHHETDTVDAPQGTHLRGGHLAAWSAARNPGTLPPRTIAVVTEQLTVPSIDSNDIMDNLFSGYEFCVLFTSAETCTKCPEVLGDKTALETLMLRHGARVVANPGRTTSLLLASTSAAPKVRHWVQLCTSRPDSVASKYAATDVVRCEWIYACVEAGTVLPLAPRHMIYASPSLVEKFTLLLDPFEDSYYEPSTLESLRHSVRLARQQLAERERSVQTLPQDPALGPVSRSIYNMRQELGLLPPTAKRLVALRRRSTYSDSSSSFVSTDPTAMVQHLLQASPSTRKLAKILAETQQHAPCGDQPVKDEPRGEEDIHCHTEEPREKRLSLEHHEIVSSEAWEVPQLIAVLAAVLHDRCCVVQEAADATHAVDECGQIFSFEMPSL